MICATCLTQSPSVVTCCPQPNWVKDHLFILRGNWQMLDENKKHLEWVLSKDDYAEQHEFCQRWLSNYSAARLLLIPFETQIAMLKNDLDAAARYAHALEHALNQLPLHFRADVEEQVRQDYRDNIAEGRALMTKLSTAHTVLHAMQVKHYAARGGPQA